MLKRGVEKPKCPECGSEMKRKGRTPPFWYKCPKCGMKHRRGEFKHVTKDQKWAHDYEIRTARSQESLRRLIRKLKKQKYLPFKEFRFLVNGTLQVINLDDYDDEGNPIKKKKVNDNVQ